jgi:hypothetical protein
MRLKIYLKNGMTAECVCNSVPLEYILAEIAENEFYAIGGIAFRTEEVVMIERVDIPVRVGVLWN